MFLLKGKILKMFCKVSLTLNSRLIRSPERAMEKWKFEKLQ